MYIKLIVHRRWENEKETAYLCCDKMNTTMGKLWEYTQEPDIHTEWDARFTEISYLEKKKENHRSFV